MIFLLKKPQWFEKRQCDGAFVAKIFCDLRKFIHLRDKHR